MKNNKKGFTLVELVIVVAVMAVLVAVAIPTVSSIINSAETSVAESNAKTIESMIKLEQAEADGEEFEIQDVLDAIVGAKLGIEKGVFNYTVATGAVASGSATASDEVFVITFNSSGISVSCGTETNDTVSSDSFDPTADATTEG